MNILLWHVHGSWTTAFVQGNHQYFLPVLPGRGPNGRGRALTWEWPTSAVEITKDEARDLPIDVVIVQRAEELCFLVEEWTGRRPGRDLPCIYLEHNAPDGRVNEMRHTAHDRHELHVVHVTYFNSLFWDIGATPSRVIEHGIVDPGYRYEGDLERAVVVVNDPVRRGRLAGRDLICRFQGRYPIDLFGMGTGDLRGLELPQAELHDAIAQRRAYLHLMRWTSLGLSLIEAMQLGMPVVTLATTEATAVVPAGAGVVSNRLEVLDRALEHFLHDKEAAIAAGREAREAALARFGLQRFLSEWDDVLLEVVAR